MRSSSDKWAENTRTLNITTQKHRSDLMDIELIYLDDTVFPALLIRRPTTANTD